MSTNKLYAVYCIWDTKSSVPGGFIAGLHRTKEGAEKAVTVATATEEARQRRPKLSRTAAIATVTEQYGYYYPHMYDAVTSLMRRASHAYEVREIDDEVVTSHGTIRRSEGQTLHD